MKPALFFLILSIGLLASRLSHARILWVEEAYPLAAASQVKMGKALYRDIWFDKPPLLAVVYLVGGARHGWPLRAAGALYALLACFLAYRFAGELWSETEARWAAALMAFFLTFDTPSAVIPLAADLLMLAPHLAAVYLAWRGRPFWSGATAGLAFAINAKGLFVLAACALWSYRSLPALAAGFVAPNLALAGWMWANRSLGAYYEQVWEWGRIYTASTFVENPFRNAVARTAAWMGFHAALVVGAFWTSRTVENRAKWIGWLGVSLFAVTLGWRFFPRYYFQLLPAMVLLAARGIPLLPMRARIAVVGLALLVPSVRFGPRYFQLAAGERGWVDTAIDRDGREAAALVRSLAAPGDTLFVWGFRPELYVYTGLPAASRFLDSQPLTGVPADRHLVDSTPVAPEMAAENRLELIRLQPTFILDGLGTYNPKLAITAYPDLAPWLSGYRVVAHSQATLIYRKLTPAERK